MPNSALQFALACFSGFQIVKLHPQHRQTTISSTYLKYLRPISTLRNKLKKTLFKSFVKSYEAKWFSLKSPNSAFQSCKVENFGLYENVSHIEWTCHFLEKKNQKKNSGPDHLWTSHKTKCSRTKAEVRVSSQWICKPKLHNHSLVLLYTYSKTLHGNMWYRALHPPHDGPQSILWTAINKK